MLLGFCPPIHHEQFIEITPVQRIMGISVPIAAGMMVIQATDIPDAIEKFSISLPEVDDLQERIYPTMPRLATYIPDAFLHVIPKELLASVLRPPHPLAGKPVLFPAFAMVSVRPDSAIGCVAQQQEACYFHIITYKKYPGPEADLERGTVMANTMLASFFAGLDTDHVHGILNASGARVMLLMLPAQTYRTITRSLVLAEMWDWQPKK